MVKELLYKCFGESLSKEALDKSIEMYKEMGFKIVKLKFNKIIDTIPLDDRKCFFRYKVEDSSLPHYILVVKDEEVLNEFKKEYNLVEV